MLFTYPSVFSGLTAGSVACFADVRAPGTAVNLHVMLFNMATVAAGEPAVCCILGLMLLCTLKKMPLRILV